MSQQDYKDTYVIGKTFLEEMVSEAAKRSEILESLIQYGLGEDSISTHRVYLLAENYVINYKMISLVREIFKYSPLTEHEETKKEEFIVRSQDMFMLQTLALARQQVTTDLENMTYLSLKLH